MKPHTTYCVHVLQEDTTGTFVAMFDTEAEKWPFRDPRGVRFGRGRTPAVAAARFLWNYHCWVAGVSPFGGFDTQVRRTMRVRDGATRAKHADAGAGI